MKNEDIKFLFDCMGNSDIMYWCRGETIAALAYDVMQANYDTALDEETDRKCKEIIEHFTSEIYNESF
jgi:hypothetical protein